MITQENLNIAKINKITKLKQWSTIYEQD
jgi:hypothetical protein